MLKQIFTFCRFQARHDHHRWTSSARVGSELCRWFSERDLQGRRYILLRVAWELRIVRIEISQERSVLRGCSLAVLHEAAIEPHQSEQTPDVL